MGDHFHIVDDVADNHEQDGCYKRYYDLVFQFISLRKAQVLPNNILRIFDSLYLDLLSKENVVPTAILAILVPIIVDS